MTLLNMYSLLNSLSLVGLTPNCTLILTNYHILRLLIRWLFNSLYARRYRCGLHKSASYTGKLVQKY